MLAVIRAIVSVCLAILILGLILGIGFVFTVIGAMIVPVTIGIGIIILLAAGIYEWWSGDQRKES